MKNAYYFPHFCNARRDRKIQRIEKDLGIEGYGIYFKLLEVLREQTNFKYPISDIDLLAIEFGTSLSKIEVVIKNYELFEIDKSNMFFSSRLILYLQPYIEKSKRASEAAMIRWENAKNQYTNNANAMQMHNKCNANAMQIKETKRKEKKEKEIEIEIKDKYLDFVYLKKKQYEDLIKRYGETGTKERIQSMNDYAHQIGESKFKKNYISHFHTLNNWERIKLSKLTNKEKEKEAIGSKYDKFS